MNEIPDWQKVQLTSTVAVRDDHGNNHVFRPGDDIPEWARDKITNPKAWGYTFEPSSRRYISGAPVEIVQEAIDIDGRPTIIDIWCDEHPSPDRPLARFEASTLLDEYDGTGLRPDGQPPQWEWWWTSSLNGKAGAFAAHSAVSWPGTGPRASSINGSAPENDEIVVLIRCNAPRCHQQVKRNWGALRHTFDKFRVVGASRVSLLVLNRASRSI